MSDNLIHCTLNVSEIVNYQILKVWSMTSKLLFEFIIESYFTNVLLLEYQEPNFL